MTLALYGKSKRRQGGLILVGLIALLVAMFAGVATYTDAFAHTATVKGKATCESDGTYSIAWEIKSDSKKYMFLDSVSTDAGTTNLADFTPNPVNDKGKIEGSTTAVPGNAASVTLTAQVDWWANANRTGDHFGPSNPSDELKLKGDCTPSAVKVQVHKYLPKDNPSEAAPWENQGVGQGTYQYTLYADSSGSKGAALSGTPNPFGHLTPSVDITPQTVWITETNTGGHNFYGWYLPEEPSSGNPKCNQAPLDFSTGNPDAKYSTAADLQIPLSYFQNTPGDRQGVYHICAYNKPGVVSPSGQLIIKKVGPTITGDDLAIIFGGDITGPNSGFWSATVGNEYLHAGIANGDYTVTETAGHGPAHIELVGFKTGTSTAACDDPAGYSLSDNQVTVDDDTQVVCVMNKFVPSTPQCVDYSANPANALVSNTVAEVGEDIVGTVVIKDDACANIKIRLSLYELTGPSWNDYTQWAHQDHIDSDFKILQPGSNTLSVSPVVCNYQADLYWVFPKDGNSPDATTPGFDETVDTAAPGLGQAYRPAPHHPHGSLTSNVLLPGGAGKAYLIEQGKVCKRNLEVCKVFQGNSDGMVRSANFNFNVFVGGVQVYNGLPGFPLASEPNPDNGTDGAKVCKTVEVDANKTLQVVEWTPSFSIDTPKHSIDAGALQTNGTTTTFGNDSSNHTVTFFNKEKTRDVTVCKSVISNGDSLDRPAFNWGFDVRPVGQNPVQQGSNSVAEPAGAAGTESDAVCKTVKVSANIDIEVVEGSSRPASPGWNDETGYPQYSINGASRVSSETTSVIAKGTSPVDVTFFNREDPLDKDIIIEKRFVNLPDGFFPDAGDRPTITIHDPAYPDVTFANSCSWQTNNTADHVYAVCTVPFDWAGTIDETPAPGWVQVRCLLTEQFDLRIEAIVVAEADVVFCNAPFGTLTINKVNNVSGAGVLWDFTVTGISKNIHGVDLDDEPQASQSVPSVQTHIPLSANSISVIEDAQGVTTQAECTNADVMFTQIIAPDDTVISEPGENIVWTFINSTCGDVLGTGGVLIEKWNDVNRNGILDAGDVQLPGWTFTTTAEGGQIPGAIQVRQTNAAGQILDYVAGLLPGTKVTTTESSQPYWALSRVTVDGVAVATNLTTTVEILAGEVRIIRYLNYFDPPTFPVCTPAECPQTPVCVPGVDPACTPVDVCVPGEDPECTEEPVCVPGTDPECTEAPVCVPGEDPECTDPTTENPTDDPEDEVRGEITPGQPTPAAPDTGAGFGGTSAGMNILLLIAGLIAISGGLSFIALGRRQTSR